MSSSWHVVFVCRATRLASPHFASPRLVTTPLVSPQLASPKSSAVRILTSMTVCPPQIFLKSLSEILQCSANITRHTSQCSGQTSCFILELVVVEIQDQFPVVIAALNAKKVQRVTKNCLNSDIDVQLTKS